MTPDEMKEGSEAIDRFLRENIGLYYCDDCLSEETDVKDPRDVNQIKQALLTMPRDFDGRMTCDGCSRRRRSVGALLARGRPLLDR